MLLKKLTLTNFRPFKGEHEIEFSINKEKNVTIFLTSHDVGDVEAICDRIIVINHGKVIKDDSVVNIQKEYASLKKISIVTNSKIQDETFLDMYNAKMDNGIIKMSIDTKLCDIVELINYFSKFVKIIDIKIHEKSMEEIITEIYKGV